MNRILLPALLITFAASCTPDGARRVRIGGTDASRAAAADANTPGLDGQIAPGPDAGTPEDGGPMMGNPDATTPPPPADGGPMMGNPDATPGPREDAGMPVGPAPLAPLGPAPGGNFTVISALDIRNDQMVARASEVAFSGIPIARSLNMTNTDGLVVVGPGDTWLQGQFDIVGRWGAPVADTSAPIRWLQVSVQASVDPSNRAQYELRRYGSVTAPADSNAARITTNGTTHTVNTGAAVFTLDSTNAALITRIEADDGNGTMVPVYTGGPQAGPILEINGGPTLDASRVSIDEVTIVERGPVKVVVAMVGHLVDPGGATRCNSGGVRYEGAAFDFVATFTRGRADVDLQLHFTNECGDAMFGPWVDEAVRVNRFGWRFPMNVGNNVTRYAAGSGAIATVGGNTVTVEQRKGGGGPWRRRARTVIDGTASDAAELYASPFAAVGGSAFAASIQQAWMQYREPASVGVDQTTLSINPISESYNIGEAKGIWAFGRLSITPRSRAPNAGALEGVRQAGLVAIERGLLVRTPKSYFNSTAVLPSIGTDATHTAKTAYLMAMNRLHNDTVNRGGQWDDAKTYGSQLWPDVQFDQWGNSNGNPNQNNAVYNYWNPSGAELLEFLRSGDPKWVWDWSMPQTWLQMFTAYCNLGDHFHGNRNGFALTSGGQGEGHWHRSDQGSDDYTYDMGQFIGFALRPNYPMIRRFRQAGRNFQVRYDVARGGRREEFVNEILLNRQFVQHLELLAVCAEYVPGTEGQACHNKLQEVLTEMSEDNFRAGVMCEGDAPATNNCSQDQQFMLNALHLPFFNRMLRNYGDVAGNLKDALVGQGMYLYAYGITKNGNLGAQDGMGLTALMGLSGRPAINVNGDWSARMECPLTAGGSRVQRCRTANDQGIDPAMFDHNKPHSLATILMSHELDNRARLCGVTKTALSAQRILTGWSDLIVDRVGWTKGTSQMMQSAIYGIGIYDTCSD